MPATVVRILVSVGDEVEQGQALVVVSAMKMETTLTAPHKGSVRAIRAEVGATVRPGDVVVDVEEKA
jgi:biotin carboxyl carrier protein